jgi:hypothetical protein
LVKNGKSQGKCKERGIYLGDGTGRKQMDKKQSRREGKLEEGRWSEKKEQERKMKRQTGEKRRKRWKTRGKKGKETRRKRYVHEYENNQLCLI